jgi:hypothetical protein
MSRRFKSLLLLLSIPALLVAVDKDKGRFSPGPAGSYPSKQSNSGLTIAVVPYDKEEQAETAFGKAHPFKHGVLPVLVVMENTGKQALRLDGMRVEFHAPNGDKVEATPARDVAYLTPPDRPKVSANPLPRIKKKKNPLAASEIDARAFAAKMLPPGESAHGFFYFQTSSLRPGSSIYITGINEAGSGKELFYFEIPLP